MPRLREVFPEHLRQPLADPLAEQIRQGARLMLAPRDWAPCRRKLLLLEMAWRRKIALQLR